MKLTELRQKSTKELQDQLLSKRTDLWQLKVDLATNKSKQTHQLAELKKDVAQISTVLREQSLIKLETANGN